MDGAPGGRGRTRPGPVAGYHEVRDGAKGALTVVKGEPGAAWPMTVGKDGGERVPPVVTFDGSTAVEGERTLPVDLERLMKSRMLIQASSGGGKSWMIRYLLEQTHGRLQQIVFDIEGEFSSIREGGEYPFVLVSATPGEGDLPAAPASAALLCRRLAELQASAILDLSDLKLSDQRRFVRIYLEELIALPKDLWLPTMIVVDEADRVAPERGSAESTEAVGSLTSRGRKRNFLPVLATTRLSKLNKDAAADLLNVLVGRTNLGNDVVRAGEDLGFDKTKRATLKGLEPGHFYAYGPAIPSEDVVLVRSGEVKTRHGDTSRGLPSREGTDGAAGPTVPPPPPPEAVRKILGQLEDLPREAELEARTVQDLKEKNGRLEAELEELKRNGRETADGKRAGRGQTKGTSPGYDPEAARAEVEKRLGRAVEEAKAPLNEEIARLEEIVGSLEATVADGRQRAEDLVASLEAGAPRARVADEIEVAEIPDEDPRPEAPGVVASGMDAPVEHEVPGRATDGLPEAQGRILAALGRLKRLGVGTLDRSNLAVFSHQSPKSSSYTAHVAALKAEGLVDYPLDRPGTVRLTERGLNVASSAVPDGDGRGRPATLGDLHAAWRGYLPDAQRRILDAALDAHPESLGRAELAGRAGQSPTSSSYMAHVATLASLGLLEYPEPGRVRAGALLYPENLRGGIGA